MDGNQILVFGIFAMAAGMYKRRMYGVGVSACFEHVGPGGKDVPHTLKFKWGCK